MRTVKGLFDELDKKRPAVRSPADVVDQALTHVRTSVGLEANRAHRNRRYLPTLAATAGATAFIVAAVVATRPDSGTGVELATRSSSAVELSVLSDQEWSIAPPAPSTAGVDWTVSATVGDTLFVVSPGPPSEYEREIVLQAFSPESSEWRRLESPPAFTDFDSVADVGLTAVSVGSEMVLIAPDPGYRHFSAVAFSRLTNTWRSLGDGPDCVSGQPQVVPGDGHIVVIVGSDKLQSAACPPSIGATLTLETQTGRWSALSRLEPTAGVASWVSAHQLAGSRVMAIAAVESSSSEDDLLSGLNGDRILGSLDLVAFQLSVRTEKWYPISGWNPNSLGASYGSDDTFLVAPQNGFCSRGNCTSDPSVIAPGSFYSRKESTVVAVNDDLSHDFAVRASYSEPDAGLFVAYEHEEETCAVGVRRRADCRPNPGVMIEAFSIVGDQFERRLLAPVPSEVQSVIDIRWVEQSLVVIGISASDELILGVIGL